WWLPWTMLALGFAGGLALDHLMPRPQQPLKAMSTEPVNKEPDNPKLVPGTISPASQTNKPPDRPSNPTAPTPMVPTDLTVTSFGTWEVDEPGFGHQELEPGAYQFALDSVFRTTKGQIGVYVMANDARVRIDLGTAARVGADHVALEFGRIFVC